MQYEYGCPVTLGPQTIRLHPAPHCKTPILSYRLKVTPEDHLLKWQFDLHQNQLAKALFSSMTDRLIVEVDLVADLAPINSFDFVLEPEVAEYPIAYSPELQREIEPYCSMESTGPLFGQFLSSIPRERTGTVQFLGGLIGRIRDEIVYVTRMEPGIQNSEETLEKRSGSCRDSAWLLVQILRRLGFASRFVSGYIIQLANGQPSVDGGNPLQEDSAELHAWAEVYLPGAGWVGLDATSGLFTSEGHIPLVCTPNASHAAPITGTHEPVEAQFSYSMSIVRLDAEASLSEPYTARQWQRIEQVAHTVDADLETMQVGLTVGGEPTFVSADDSDSPEWNIQALGPAKLKRGFELIRRLHARVTRGALLHFGQGKWYPGEPLPRWALGCYWRVDGIPVWENVQLIVQDNQDYGCKPSDARVFLESLARRLRASPENIMAAFPQDDGSADAAGYVLPIRRRQPGGRLSWSSQLWFPRPERLVLTGGDSPIGYRVPTDALPWVAPDKLEYEADAAPFADRAKLPIGAPRHSEWIGSEPPKDPLPAVLTKPEDAAVLIRPSLCTQVREGRMHVFLPFVSELADYLELVAAVEDVCLYLKQPVWLEGYPPPSDPRLRSFTAIPDPGVLEVNLPPMSSWQEIESVHAVLFEEAGQCRLAAEKFSWEGNHLSTGGGNHITLGGSEVLKSPFLRRPDLLRSMVIFWQNHPSLSYLFSGMYVGPTSQSPRVDEARMDSLYELEVAFRNLPDGECSPEIVDAVFRNLLVDMTGNAHRAEFCVDKLYPPAGRGSRIGLLELRAFETMPTPRMSLLILLIVRALIAVFWKNPFEGRLVRWGTALHERFLLPHFVHEDLIEVLSFLRSAGYGFEDEWFAPHFAFRFPKAGCVSGNGVELELRFALEPWNVLAEETTSGGTVRTVDSSLERLQVRLSGAYPDLRYAVLCNGQRVPLRTTAAQGELIGAVRFRARQLSTALHPTIPVHSPLVFDIVDQLTGKSVARCLYDVAGVPLEQSARRPSNAIEAEERRMKRFVPLQASSDGVSVPPEQTSSIFPMTLDLRFQASADQRGSIE